MAIKLNLGAGDSRITNFINIDKYDKAADVMADICYLPYSDGSVDEIVAYQVIEHLPYWQTSIMENSTPTFFEECYRVLEPGGTMVTECPDLEYIAKRIVDTGDISYNTMVNIYGEYYRPWDKNRYHDWEHTAVGLHITGFTWSKIQKIAHYCGFSHVDKIPTQQKKDKYDENLAVRWEK